MSSRNRNDFELAIRQYEFDSASFIDEAEQNKSSVTQNSISSGLHNTTIHLNKLLEIEFESLERRVNLAKNIAKEIILSGKPIKKDHHRNAITEFVMQILETEAAKATQRFLTHSFIQQIPNGPTLAQNRIEEWVKSIKSQLEEEFAIEIERNRLGVGTEPLITRIGNWFWNNIILHFMQKWIVYSVGAAGMLIIVMLFGKDVIEMFLANLGM